MLWSLCALNAIHDYERHVKCLSLVVSAEVYTLWKVKFKWRVHAWIGHESQIMHHTSPTWCIRRFIPRMWVSNCTHLARISCVFCNSPTWHLRMIILCTQEPIHMHLARISYMSPVSPMRHVHSSTPTSVVEVFQHVQNCNDKPQQTMSGTEWHQVSHESHMQQRNWVSYHITQSTTI